MKIRHIPAVLAAFTFFFGFTVLVVMRIIAMWPNLKLGWRLVLLSVSLAFVAILIEGVRMFRD